MARTNFTDDQRAIVYVRDRATCAYSGRSLWALDYGFDPTYGRDWIDHVAPASQGGLSRPENGIASSWIFNYLRGAGQQGLVLFRDGVPTSKYLWHFEEVSADVAANLARFSRLHESDWFLNRALSHFILGMGTIADRAHGLKRTRGPEYWAAAAAKALAQWRRRATKYQVPGVEARSLVLHPMESDHRALLSVRDLSTQEELLNHIHQHFPAYSNTVELIDRLCQAQSRKDLENVRIAANAAIEVPPRLVQRTLRNIDKLLPLFPEAKAGHLAA